MSSHPPPFLVIGAGPVGLAMAKALAEAGLAYDHVEATDHVGGNWAHGVYDTAHIISSRDTTQFPDFPMPRDYPAFPSRLQMRDYFESFTDAFGLRAAIRFCTRVDAVERTEHGWHVTFADGDRRDYRGLFVCNGHHWKRNLPPWAGDFEGTILHSGAYRHPDELRGQRVLVVGGGNSGCDLASEAARVGASADWSLRRGYWILPKTVFGRPVVELIHPAIPVVAQRWLLRAVARLVLGRYERYGLPTPDHAPFDRHPTINTEVFRYLDHGTLRPRPDVATVQGQTVTFADGTRATYDVIVCATGFQVAFPFLEEGLVPVRGKVPGLIAGTLVPGQRHLYIVGAFQARYGLGPVVRPYARMLARWAALQDELEVPLADVLVALGQKPATTELVDPFHAIRKIRLSRLADPVLRWKARRLADAEPR